MIPPKFMHILWFAGLRGAVAYACAKNFPNEYGNTHEFVTTTMIIVLVTIIFMGGFTEHLLDSLEIRSNVDEKEYMKTWHRQRRLKGSFHRFGKASAFEGGKIVFLFLHCLLTP